MMCRARIHRISVAFVAALLFSVAPALAQQTQEEKEGKQGQEQQQSQPEQGQGQPGEGLPEEGLVGQGEGQDDMTQTRLAGTALSDAEILHVFITANKGEVVTSQPIGDGAESEVRRYAQHMVDMHSDVLARADSLAGQMGLQPQTNMVSATLEQIAQGVAGRLQGLDDPDHRDMQYMTSQIALHQQTLDMLDFVLIPSAQDESLRTMLSQARATVMRHLEQAKQIHDDLD